jgi:predicted house-cleaning noncanonical NTP pyrophosphatase (MazG superfamily)
MKVYNKLVRDKIPEIIKAKGGRPRTHIATPPEYRLRLKDKLLEEVNEFLESGDVEEIADIHEVLDAILEDLEFSKTEMEAVKVKKAKERGRFQKRIILDSA